MNKEFTAPSLIVLLWSALMAAFLVALTLDYWTLVDFFALPVSDTAQLLSMREYGVLALILLGVLDVVKAVFVDGLIWVGGYDLHRTFTVIVAGITLIVITLLLVRRRVAYLVSSMMLIASLGFAVGVGVTVSKSDVDAAFYSYARGDDSGTDIMALLDAHDYDALDKLLLGLKDDVTSGRKSEIAYRLEYDKFSEVGEQRMALMDEWVSRSSFPAGAYLARGVAYTDMAWSARGSKFASETSEQQFDELHRLLAIAEADLSKAILLDEDAFNAYVVIVNNTGSGSDAAEGKAWYQKALAKYPYSYYLSYRYIVKRQPRWGGSIQEMRQIAGDRRVAAENNPQLIALGGVELVESGDTAWRNEDYHTAKKLYHRALLYAPRQSVYVRLYTANMDADDYESARQAMIDCLDHHPFNSKCWLYRAVANIKLTEPKLARQSVQMALSEGLSKGWEYRYVAWIYSSMHEDAESAKYYMLASDVDPDDIYSLKAIYRASYYGQISMQQTLPYMERWTRIDPAAAGPWLKLADTLEDIRPTDAIPHYRKYLSLVDMEDESEQKSIEYAKKMVVELSGRH